MSADPTAEHITCPMCGEQVPMIDGTASHACRKAESVTAPEPECIADPARSCHIDLGGHGPREVHDHPMTAPDPTAERLAPSALNPDVSQVVVDTTFDRRVEVTPSCWYWTGSRTRDYGHISYWSLIKRRSTSAQAHRFVWSVLVGPIPDDMTLDHLCKNTLCVNPDHLRVLDNVTNSLLGFSPHAMNARKTHCPQGHPLSGSNLGEGTKGERLCLACRRERARKFDAERKPCPKCQKMLTRAPRTRHRRFGCSTRQPN